MAQKELIVQVSRLNSDDGHPLWSAVVQDAVMLPRTAKSREEALQRATDAHLKALGYKNPKVEVSEVP